MKTQKEVSIDVNQLISHIEEITASLVVPIPQGYQGFCPVHDDKGKSLRILENGNQGYQISCIKGCTTDLILEKLGFSTKREYGHFTPIPESKKTKTGVRVIGLNDFLEMELPKKEMILSPFLTTQGIALVYAKRGLGKPVYRSGLLML